MFSPTISLLQSFRVPDGVIFLVTSFHLTIKVSCQSFPMRNKYLFGLSTFNPILMHEAKNIINLACCGLLTQKMKISVHTQIS